MNKKFKFLIYTNLKNENFNNLNQKIFINFLEKTKKTNFKLDKKFSFIVFENKKELSITKKISLISSILEKIRALNLKKKIIFIFVYRGINDFKKLEKKIFFEMINAYNNMFSLNILLYEIKDLKQKIDLNKISKKYKL